MRKLILAVWTFWMVFYLDGLGDPHNWIDLPFTCALYTSPWLLAYA
jgi:hypothetical protein